MAYEIMLIESFQGYANPDQIAAGGKWDVGLSTTTYVTLIEGPRGTPSKALNLFAAGDKVGRSLGSYTGAAGVWYMACRRRSSSGGEAAVIGLSDLQGRGVVQLQVAVGSGLPMIRTDGSGYALGAYEHVLGIGSQSVNDGEWHFFEILADVQDANSTSTVQLWIDGELVVDYSGTLDTVPAGAPTSEFPTTFMMGQVSNITNGVRNSDQDFADVILMRGGVTAGPEMVVPSGGPPYGDVVVDAFFPTTLVSAGAWTPTAGTEVEAVDGDDKVFNDADSVQSSTLTSPALFSTTDTFTRSVHSVIGVAVTARAKKTQSGVVQQVNLMRTDGTATDRVSTVPKYLATSMHQVQNLWAFDPATSSGWMAATVEATVFGTQISSFS